jgi:hypothetical protein
MTEIIFQYQFHTSNFVPDQFRCQFQLVFIHDAQIHYNKQEFPSLKANRGKSRVHIKNHKF